MQKKHSRFHSAILFFINLTFLTINILKNEYLSNLLYSFKIFYLIFSKLFPDCRIFCDKATFFFGGAPYFISFLPLVSGYFPRMNRR